MAKIKITYDVVTVTTYSEVVEVEDVQTAVDMVGIGSFGDDDDAKIDDETIEVKARKVWVEQDGEWVQQSCPQIDWAGIGMAEFALNDMTFAEA